MNLRPGWLSEEELSEIVLQQERVRNAQGREKANDVAVEQDRLPSAGCRIRAVLQLELIDDDVFGVAGVARLRRAEKAEQRAFRSEQARELIGERLCGGAIQIVEDIPAEDAVDRILQRRKAGFQKTWNRRNIPVLKCRSRSAKISSTRILHPSCSPKKLTLGPMTGPRSSRTGDSRAVRQARNLRKALVANTTSSDGATGTGASVRAFEVRCGLGDPLGKQKKVQRFKVQRFNSNLLNLFEPLEPLEPVLGSDALTGPSSDRSGGDRRGCRALAAATQLAWPSPAPAAFFCIVDAAAEVRAFGNRHARRDDVAIDRSVVADVDLIAGGDISRHFAEHDDRLGEHLRLDSAVRPNREDVFFELNGPFDVTFDGQVFTAVQLTFDRQPISRCSQCPSPCFGPPQGEESVPAGADGWDCGVIAAGPFAGRTASSRFHMSSSALLRLPGAPGPQMCSFSAQKSRKYMGALKACLVLLLLKVSANATM